jgi:hypothetical protein
VSCDCCTPLFQTTTCISITGILTGLSIQSVPCRYPCKVGTVVVHGSLQFVAWDLLQGWPAKVFKQSRTYVMSYQNTDVGNRVSL